MAGSNPHVQYNRQTGVCRLGFDFEYILTYLDGLLGVEHDHRRSASKAEFPIRFVDHPIIGRAGIESNLDIVVNDEAELLEFRDGWAEGIGALPFDQARQATARTAPKRDVARLGHVRPQAAE